MIATGEIFDVARLIVGVVILIFASHTDWKTRRAPNILWIFLAIAGLLIIEFQSIATDKPAICRLTLIPVAIFFATIITDGEIFTRILDKKKNAMIVIGLNIFAILAIVFQVYTQGLGDAYFVQLITIPIMFLIFRGMYSAGLLHGGADAKAMLAIAILVPFYPKIANFPLLGSPKLAVTELVLPYSLVILFNSVILFIFVPIVFLIYNGIRGNLVFPQCILGYKMRLEDVPKRFVWLMERIVGGERKMFFFPSKNYKLNMELTKLKNEKITSVWVTPKIPFLIPIAVGFVTAFIFGNILLQIIYLMP
ncbi:MAG: A24 family peptidase C-terminal domain-containing protein [Thermoplasmata archaeon]